MLQARANGGIHSSSALSINSSTYGSNAAGTTSNNTGLEPSADSRQPQQQQQQQQQVSKTETLDPSISPFNLIPLVVR